MSIARSERPGFSLILILGLFAATNLAGLYLLLFKAENFKELFIPLSAGYIRLIAIIPAITLLGIGGLWYGKRWGLILVTLTFVAIITVDGIFRISAHLALVSFAYLGLILLFFKSDEKAN